ncbi:MAG: HD domain-containing protein [Myxococcaceae bacterium]|nr:HD domain-containing protein [Myxococcaceae bacterium]
MRIRDPIHGTLSVSDEEKAVVDSRFYQRLRQVRQLGFGELAFPGATHTRHAHSLGAMHVSGRLFDAVAERSTLSPRARERFRAAVRAAVLCHDLGHMPLSHASESIAPLRSKLGLPAWVNGGRGAAVTPERHSGRETPNVPPADPEHDGEREQAAHEDFTVRLLLDSELTGVLRTGYAKYDVTPEHIASLVTGVDPPGGSPFVDGGADWSPLLRSLVSGELDADRMDYLLRDSFFTGVNYGRYDFDWVVNNLNPAAKDGRVYLALSKAAAFAFEDFLLSRYHMFLSVYYHHTSVSFDHMLRAWYAEAPGEFEIPADPDAFVFCDDVALWSALRKSQNRWAERLVGRRGFKRVAEFTERDTSYDLKALQAALDASGVEHFAVESRGVLSRYFEEASRSPLYIVDISSGRLTDVQSYTPLYQRYAGAVRLSRVYVRPDQADEGRKVVARLTGAKS